MDKVLKGRDYLESVRHIERLIERLKMQIELEESMLTDTAIHYKDVNVQTSGVKDLMSEKIPEIIELREELEKYIRSLERKKLTILRVIKRIDKLDQQQLIILRYLQGMTIEQTADSMGWSYTWTWNALRRAVEEFENLFEEYNEEQKEGA